MSDNGTHSSSSNSDGLRVWFNSQGVCDYLCISNATLEKWRAAGMPYCRVGRCLRYNRKRIDRWLLRRQITESIRDYDHAG